MAISAVGLTKRYGCTLALDALTLAVPDGAVYGLLGPNGSGKSTLARLVMGFLFADAGRLDLGDLAPRDIGFMPERPAFPPGCHVAEYLRLMADLAGLRGARRKVAVEDGLEQVGLEQCALWRVAALSKGMLQRLALAAALIGSPACLVLDEPTAGLDPAWQATVLQLVQSAAREGRTVLLSTHRLDDVRAACTHVAILRRGKAVAAGALSDLLPPGGECVISARAMPEGLAPVLPALHDGVSVRGSEVRLAGGAEEHKAAVLRLLLDGGADLVDLRQSRPSLEDLYAQVMKT